jgi:hypothetical protein
MSRIFHRRSAIRSPFRGSIAASFLLLAGCVQPTTPAPQTAAAPPADPILRAVATAAVNVPVSVTSPAHSTSITLTVTSDYISAEGQECRAYTLGAAANLACTNGTSWRHIPALAPSDNPGPTQ